MTTQQHLAAGAYALGVLDPSDAWRFEAHMDECPVCSAQLREFAGIESLLTAFAAWVPPGENWLRGPGGALMHRMLDEVAAVRRASRRRRLYLVAAAAALAVCGTAVVGTGAAPWSLGTPDQARPAEHRPSLSAEQQVRALGEKVRHTDAATSVSAMVGMERTGWGTDVGLELRNVRGPLKCRLVAVGRSGVEETVTSWSVPAPGYGIPGTASSDDYLYAQGGTAMDPGDIQRFDVRTADGNLLVSVDA